MMRNVIVIALAVVLALSAAVYPMAHAAAVPAAGSAAAVQAPERIDPGTDAWERVPRDRVAEECGMDPDLLEQADLRLAPFAYTVVRHGKLCWEANHTDEAYHVASITKTIGALLVGYATSRSSLSDTDRLDEWVDLSNWPLVNPDSTLAHALAMVAYNPTHEYPAKQWMYDTLGDREIDTLMEAIDAVIAAEPEAFAGVSDRVDLKAELFDKLGMSSSTWEGETFGFTADSTPRDLARLGVLIARRGFYNGEQLIDPEYIYRLTHPVFEDGNTGYGYLTYLNADAGWFYSTGTPDQVCSPVATWPAYPHRPFYEAEHDHGGAQTRGEQDYDVGVVWASGAGGQRLTVHRGLDLVMTIRDESTNEGHKSVWNAIRPALVAEDPVFDGDETAFCEAYRDGAYAPDLLPDLTVAPPRPVVDGDEVRFTAVVSNPGEQHATDVPVRFSVDGVPVGPDVTVEELKFRDSVTLTSAAWSPPAGDGTHTVRVEVDPGGTIPESGVAPSAAETAFSLPAAGASVERYAGADRVATAAAVAGAGREQADTVVIARADDPADALAGAPLAAHLDAPLLLTRGDRLSTATAREVRRLGAEEAILLGGEAALAAEVAADLANLPVEVPVVRRIAGANRWETAAAIAAELPDAGEVFVVLGDAGGFADAISVSGLAAGAEQPILLTRSSGLPAEAAEAIDADVEVVIIGGPSAVSAAVEGDLADQAAGVRRLAGADRYATSAAVAGEAIGRDLASDVVWVATGTAFPDGLVAGPAAARDDALLLLVHGQDLDASSSTRDLLGARAPTTVRISGGPAAVSAHAYGQIEALLR